MNTGKLTYVFRKIGLIHLLDKVKYHYFKLKNNQLNQKFINEHPEVKLPPDYMMFESFQLNYYKYYNGGRQSAIWIKDKALKYTDTNTLNILDWGCGPARICRHLPGLMKKECQFFATDYNQDTINWCRSNIKNIKFDINGIDPPTIYSSDFFDFTYGISIFTHLSEKNHQNWIAELRRITKKDGVILLTTHGTAYKEILTDFEVEQFDLGKLVTRDQAIEGHRVYAAFHPPSYMEMLFINNGFLILDHEVGVKKDWGIQQDTWIIQKI